MESIKVKAPALVLSGGGMKAAAFHVGVSLALKQKGFNVSYNKKKRTNMSFNWYVGSSAGSIIAAFYAAGYTVEDVIYAFTQGKSNLGSFELDNPQVELPPLRYKDIFTIKLASKNPIKWIPNLFTGNSKVWGGFEVLLKKTFKANGLFSTHGIGDYFDRAVLKDGGLKFNQMDPNLFIVATFLDHAKKAVFCSEKAKTSRKFTNEDTDFITNIKISDAIKASIALPPVFSPYKIDDEYFFDGEVRDSLSSHVALEQGADLAIVSYSMHPYELNKEMGSLSEYGIPLIANQALYQLIQQKISSHVRNRENMSNLFKSLEKDLSKHMESSEIKKLVNKLEKNYMPDRKARVIYIHPSPQDYEMFFADHFSLNPKILNKIVTTGFKAAMDTLKNFEFK